MSIIIYKCKLYILKCIIPNEYTTKSDIFRDSFTKYFLSYSLALLVRLSLDFRTTLFRSCQKVWTACVCKVTANNPIENSSLSFSKDFFVIHSLFIFFFLWKKPEDWDCFSMMVSVRIKHKLAKHLIMKVHTAQNMYSDIIFTLEHLWMN